MTDLAVALRNEARLNAQMPILIQLLIDQQQWIRKNLSEGHVPGAIPDCSGCATCTNAKRGHELLRRFEKTGLTDMVSTLKA